MRFSPQVRLIVTVGSIFGLTGIMANNVVSLAGVVAGYVGHQGADGKQGALFIDQREMDGEEVVLAVGQGELIVFLDGSVAPHDVDVALAEAAGGLAVEYLGIGASGNRRCRLADAGIHLPVG